MRTDLQQIAAQFGVKIRNVERAKHAALTEVYIADCKYVLRSRPLSNETISRFLKEQRLLEMVSKLISVQFPGLLPTASGEKYITKENLLWTVYPLIEGEILCGWYELEKLDEMKKKNVFTTLKEIHSRTTGKLEGIGSEFHLLSDVRGKFSEVRRDLSEEGRARIEKALQNVEKIETNLPRNSLCFIHGDYHPGNIVFQSSSVVGLIDTDWVRTGYYLEDLAYTIMMFLRDYREPEFEFRGQYFEKFIAWYRVPEEHIQQLKEYILLYTFYDVHIFKNLPQSARQELYLSYQHSMLSTLSWEF